MVAGNSQASGTKAGTVRGRKHASSDAANRTRYGVADMRAFLDALSQLQQRQKESDSMRRLLAHLQQAVDPVADYPLTRIGLAFLEFVAGSGTYCRAFVGADPPVLTDPVLAVSVRNAAARSLACTR